MDKILQKNDFIGFFKKNKFLNESGDLVFGVPKEQTNLLNKINTNIANIKTNGELDKIINKWL